MKKITMLLMFLVATVQSHAQLYEGFEGGTFPPTGWTSFAPENDLGIEESWESSTAFANTGSRSAFMSYEAADDFVEDWLVTPLTMVPTAQPTLTFAQRQQFTIAYNSEYRVMISTTSQTDIASFTAISTETEVEVPSDAFGIKTIDLTAYAGQEIYIAFVMSNQDGDNWFIDDITVGEPPALPEVPGCVSNPTPVDGAVDIPFGAITLSWDAPTTGEAPTAYDLFAGNAPNALTLLGTYLTTDSGDDLGIQAYNATIYWQIVPKNAGGSATGCPVWSFTTEAAPAAPENDACEGAIAAILPYTNTQDATGATNNTGFITACSASSTAMNDGVWYSVEGNGLDLTIALSEVGDWDPQLDVYTGSCGDFVCAGSTDNGGTGDGETLIIPGSVVGTTYYINVGHYSGTADNLEGTFTISIEGTEPPVAPENDDCATPTVLTPGATLEENLILSTNVGATRNANDATPTCGAFGFATVGKDVWFSVVVPDSGSVTVETTNSQSIEDTILEVYSGTCGNLTSLGCNDDNLEADTTFSKVVVEDANPGDVLLVRVWGYNGEAGSFNISAYDIPLATTSFNNANFKFHPNPVTNVLNLSYSKEISNVAVYNLVGQQVMVKSANAAQSQIDMSELASGTYIVKVTSGNEVKTIKVVKD